MHCRAQRDFLQRKVFEKEGTLADAKADRKETERDRKIHEAISNLKRLFPGTNCIRTSYVIAIEPLDQLLELNKGMYCFMNINAMQKG